MKKKIIATMLASTMLTGITLNMVNANPQPTTMVAAPTVLVAPHPIQLNAAAWVLMNYQTGEIIADENQDVRRAPASLTKIMTAYIVASELKEGILKPDEEITISAKAAATGGSKMFLKAGERVSIENLLQGLIVQSGNDAAVALAEYIGGSEENFVDIMNQTAQALGMSNTQFADANGLPGGEQYTTALDMAVLARAFIFNFPDVYKIYSQRSFTWNGITQSNRNGLLNTFEGADGMKTGFTNEAGYNLIASANRDGERYISVVLGAPSANIREQESIKLLRFGFSRYSNEILAKSNQPIDLGAVDINGAKKGSTLSVAVQEDMLRTIPRNFVNHLQQRVALNQGLSAPIKKGQVVGTLFITAGDNDVAQAPVVAVNNVDKAGFFSRWF